MAEHVYRCNRSSLVMLLVAATACFGCDERQGKLDEAIEQAKSAASARTSANAPRPAATAPFKTLPSLSVDETGVSLGTRVDMTKPHPATRLQKAVNRLPIDGEVSIVVLPKSKTKNVALFVDMLGKKGATKIRLKTQGRADLPNEIVVTPESALTTPAPCSIAITVTEDVSTAVWAFKGGGGVRHKKGLAGPDLTHTAETLEKTLARCDSDTAFFSADEKQPWRDAFNVGALLTKLDKDKKVKKLVLPVKDIVAGRPIVLGAAK